jgi:hypothetical protein
VRLRDISESLGITGCSSGACVFGAPKVHTKAVARHLARLVAYLDKLREDYER